MVEETENLFEITVKPTNEIVPSIVCTLKLPNFFTLPKYKKSFSMFSPSFPFADTTWRFQFFAEKDSVASGTYFYTNLVRLSSETPGQKIFSTATLLDANDKICSRSDQVCSFTKETAKIGFFYKSESSYDTRNILKLIVHLISKKIEVESDQAPSIPHKGISLCQDLKDVLLNGQDYNIMFNVRGKELKAHRDILEARSEFFHSMFSHDILDKNSKVINLPDCDPEAFEQFLFYVYTGETKELNEKNMFGLYYIADKYSFVQLKEECCAFIKNSLSTTNIRHAVELAEKHGDAGLMNFAMSYFTSNADVIWPNDEWQLFMKENYVVANEFIAKSLKKSHEENAKHFPLL